MARTDGLAEREWVELTTRTKPREVLLDPLVRSHDWNMLNNRKPLGFCCRRSCCRRRGPTSTSIRYFSTRVPPRPADAWGCSPWRGTTMPAASRSASEAGTTTLGRFEQNVALLTGEHRLGRGRRRQGRRFLAPGPEPGGAPGAEPVADASTSSRSKVATAPTASSSGPGGRTSTFGPTRTQRVSLQWVRPTTSATWIRATTTTWARSSCSSANGISDESGQWDLSARSSLGGGLAYNRGGLAASGRSDLDPFYFRGSIEGIARRALAHGLESGRARIRWPPGEATTTRPSSGRSTSRARIRSSQLSQPVPPLAGRAARSART